MTEFSNAGRPDHNETISDSGDRRRPGRPGDVAPELIPLLRGELTETPYDQHDQFGDPDQLSSVKGILVGVLLAIAPWVLIACAAWFVFAR